MIYIRHRTQKQISRMCALAVSAQLYGHSPDHMARCAFKDANHYYHPYRMITVWNGKQMIGWGCVVKSEWLWRYVKPRYRKQGIGSKLQRMLRYRWTQ